MSAKIIPFPTQNENPCEEIDRHIQIYLSEIASDSEFIDHISKRMKEFIEKYTCKSFEPTFKLVVPPNLSQEEASALVASIDRGIQHTAAEVQDMVSNIIIERLHLEIEMYEKHHHVKHRLC